MKTFACFLLALATGILAGPVPAQPVVELRSPHLEPPTIATTPDTPTVPSIVASISSAVDQLGTTVRGFSGDAAQVTTDAARLAATTRAGASAMGSLTVSGSIGGGGSVSLGGGAAGPLQAPMAHLATAVRGLLTDLEGQRAAIRAADASPAVQAAVADVRVGFMSFFACLGGSEVLLSGDARGTATELGAQMAALLSQGADLFSSPDDCSCSDDDDGDDGDDDTPATTTAAATAIVPLFPLPAAATNTASPATGTAAGNTASPVAAPAPAGNTASPVAAPAPAGSTASPVAAPAPATDGASPVPAATSSSYPGVSSAAPTASSGAAGATVSTTPVTAGARAPNAVGHVGLVAGLAAALLV
ncbi:hypothetical protein GGR56DRAFT_681173 [Xylariaceae sp. FL0804]|nr:hypothetical protein GGR56DRAFT_681173 [Xylariaceae sp. FL0804]